MRANNSSHGNVPNLVVDARSGIFEDIDLSRKSNVICRRAIGNIKLGSGSQLEIWGTHGYSVAKTIQFAAGSHQGTALRIREMAANVTLSFAGVTTGSHLRIEVDRLAATDSAATLNAILGTLAAGVTVTGWIGSYSFGSRVIDEVPVENVHAVAKSHGGRMRIACTEEDLSATNFPDAQHWPDVCTFAIYATRIGNNLAGRILLEKHVTGVRWPANYYYRLTDGQLYPTTDGTDTATADLRDYMGNSREMFYSEQLRHEPLNIHGTIFHTLTAPRSRLQQHIVRRYQASSFQLLFDFPTFDLNVSMFVGELLVHKNSGDQSNKWTEKNKVRFDRASKNRYTLNLGKDSVFDTAPLKVSDFFHVANWVHNINAGSHTNLQQVSGQANMVLPYLPNTELVAEVEFSVAIETT